MDNELIKVSEDGFQLIHTSKEQAYGYIVPRESPTTVKYLINIRDYNDFEADIHKQIKLSNQIYMWEGVVSNAVDALVEFAVTNMKIKGLKGKNRTVIDEWLDRLNFNAENIGTGINSYNSQCALEWFLSGNNFNFKNWDSMNTKSGKIELPTEILLMNPQNIEIPEELMTIGNKTILFRPPVEVTNLVQSDNRTLSAEEKLILDSMPSFFKKALKDHDVVPLTPDICTHVKRKGRNYLPWGRPYLSKVFNSVAHKRKLQLLDQVTMEGLINNIIIFKIGDPKEPKTWDAARLRAFHNLISSPSPSLMLVWSYDVDMIRSGPDPEVLNFESKYQQAESDILMSMGIPISILTGEAKGDQYTAIAALLERLEDWRNEHGNFIKETIKEIFKRNNLPDQDFRVTWGHSRLRNEKELRDLVLSLYDRGLLSKNTTLEQANHDIELEEELKKEEKSKGLDKTMAPPQLPFSGMNPVKQIQSPQRKQITAPKENTGKKPNTDTSTKIDKPNVKLNNKSEAGLVNEVFADIMKDVFDGVREEKDTQRIIMRSMVLPVRTEEFIKNLLNISDDFGIKIDKLLADNVDKRKDKYLDKIFSFSKKRNGKALMKKEMKKFIIEISELIERSIDV